MNQAKRNDYRERAKALVGEMTLEEKVSQLRHESLPIKRLGIEAYNWWNEALHGVARAGVATMFPQAIALAALFDEDLMREIGDVIATEGRIKYHIAQSFEDRGMYKGLTFWSPNVNIFRDPRWGRGHETYGEDPYLTSRMGVAFVKGLQGNDTDYLKSAACAKHFAVHSGPEECRHEFDAAVNAYDLWDTYLPAFEACVKEGQVEGIMGAYNRVNGEPACGSQTLIKEILEKQWGFDGYFVSDCWAISDFHEFHKITKNSIESAALAINNGCHLNCGVTYLYVQQAYEAGLVSMEAIDEAVERVVATRMRLGILGESHTQYEHLDAARLDCQEHQELAKQAAAKSMVLLKNNGVLPLNKDEIKSIGVIGPNSDSREALMGNYSGTASRYITPLQGIQDAVGESVKVYYSEGCHLYKRPDPGQCAHLPTIAEAVHVAKQSDVVVLCLGLDATIEGEAGDASNEFGSGDKNTLNLPGYQQELLEEVTRIGKPTIVVLLSGSALAVNWAHEHCDGILQAWYPGAGGGEALADILFGKVSPSGRLPVTFYKGLEQLPEFEDYSMAGRTYRYMEDEPLYPFGYGQSYTTFAYSQLSVSDVALGDRGTLTLEVEICNTGKYQGDEVVQVYSRCEDRTYKAPLRKLCGMKRIHLMPGEKQKVQMVLDASCVTLINEDGQKYIPDAMFTLYVGGSQPDSRSIALTGQGPQTVQIHAKGQQ
ncbi:MAG: glycoside hydrolase family 3 C-terminal domain-containing protein [Cellulosilyticaceae bacterium]